MRATHINFRWLTGANLGNLTSGSGVPSGGTDGDYYIDTATGLVYGPKSGTWPAALLVPALDNISNVTAPSPSLGQVLKWNGSAWINDTDLNSGGGATLIDDLTDVALSSPVNGQVLKFNGTNWVNDTDLTTGGTGVLISGATVTPGAGTGTNGDYYLCTATGLIWGPKAAGAWPAAAITSGLVIPGFIGIPKGIAGPDVWVWGTGDSLALENFIEQHRRVYLVAGTTTDVYSLTGQSYRLDNGTTHRMLTLPGRCHIEGNGSNITSYNMLDGHRVLGWMNSAGGANGFQSNSDYGRFLVRDINLFANAASGSDKTIAFDMGGTSPEFARDGQQPIPYGLTVSALSGNGITVVATAGTFVTSDVGREIGNRQYADGNSNNGTNNGRGTIVSVEDSGHCTINVTVAFVGYSGTGPYTLNAPQFYGKTQGTTLTFPDGPGVRLEDIWIDSDVPVFKFISSFNDRFTVRLNVPGTGQYHQTYHISQTSTHGRFYAAAPSTTLGVGGTVTPGNWYWGAYSAGNFSLTPARAQLKNIKTVGGYIGQRHLAMQYSSGEGFEANGHKIGICLQGDTLGSGAVDVTNSTSRFFVQNCEIAYLWMNDGRDTWSGMDYHLTGGLWCKDFIKTGFCFRHCTELLALLESGVMAPATGIVIIEGGSDEFYNHNYDPSNDGRTYYFRDSYERWVSFTADQAIYDIGPYFTVEIKNRRSAINGDPGYMGRLQGKGSKLIIGEGSLWSNITYGARAYDKWGSVEFTSYIPIQPFGLFENVNRFPELHEADRSLNPSSWSSLIANGYNASIGMCGPREGVFEGSLEVDLHPNWNPLVPDFTDSDVQVTWTRDRDPNTGMGCSKLAWPNPPSTYKAHSRMFRGWSSADDNSGYRGGAYKISLANLESVAVRVIVYISTSGKTYQFGCDPAAYNGTLAEAFTLWPSDVAGRVVWQDIVIPLTSVSMADKRFSIQILSPTNQTVNILATRLAVATGHRYDMGRFNAVLRDGAWNYPKKASA